MSLHSVGEINWTGPILYLGDAVETAHKRIQRVEETQDVVQGSCQTGIVVHEGQLNRWRRHDTHLRRK